MKQQPIAEVLVQHEDWLRRLARRLVGDAAMAEDAVQEAWVAALSNPPQNVEPSKMKAWIGGVVRNVALGQIRAASIRRAREREAVAREEDDEDLDLKKQELVELVLESLASLEEPERELVQRRYFDDIPPRRIAEELGMSASIVRNRLTRAVHKLREELDRRFGGDRRAWVALLYRIAGPAQSSLKALAALAALLVSLVVWALADVDSEDLAQPDSATNEVAALDVEVVPPADNGVAESRLPATAIETVEDSALAETVEPEGTWLEGEIICPPNTPAGETPTIRLVEPLSSEALLPTFHMDMVALGQWILDRPWTELTNTTSRLEPDGRLVFRVRVPEDRKRVHVAIDGRFLYLPGAEAVDLALGQTNKVELHPVLGALVQVRFERADGLPYEDSGLPDPDARWLAAPNVTYIEHMVPSFSRSRLRRGALDGDGTFEVRGLPAGAVYWLGIRSNIHGLRARELPALRAGETHELRFLVDTAPRIRGLVVDEDGLPIEGATVGLQGGSLGYLFPPAPSLMQLLTTTDSQGTYEFPRQPIDQPWGERTPKDGLISSAVLHAKKPGYLKNYEPVLPGTADTTLVLSRGIEYGGQVLWPDGTPAVDARVHVMIDRSNDPTWVLSPSTDTQTDEQGRFSVTGLVSGTLAVRVEANRDVEGRSEAGWAYLRNLVNGGPEATIELQPAAQVVGRVLSSDGTPVSAFTILADPLPDLPEGVTQREDMVAIRHGGPFAYRRRAPERIRWRDPGGWFELDGLLGGTWRVFIQAPGHSLSEPHIVQATDQDELDIRLLPARELEGTVLDHNGQPAPYAFIEFGTRAGFYATSNNDLAPEITRVHANGDGRFRIVDAHGGISFLRARLPGHGPSLPTYVEPAPGWPGPFTEPLQPAQVTVELRPNAGLSVMVVDQDGAPASDWNVTLFARDKSEVRRGIVSITGRCWFEDLAPVVYDTRIMRVDQASGRDPESTTEQDMIDREVDLTVDHHQELTIVVP